MTAHAFADITPIRPELSDSNRKKLRTFLDDLSEDADVVRDQRQKAREDTNFLYKPNGHWDGFLVAWKGRILFVVRAESIAKGLRTFAGVDARATFHFSPCARILFFWKKVKGTSGWFITIWARALFNPCRGSCWGDLIPG